MLEHKGNYKATAAVTSSATDITDEILLEHTAKDAAILLTNIGANLTGLELQVKAAKADSFTTLISGSGWNASASNRGIIFGTNNLHTLASGSSGVAHISVGPWYSMKLRATCGTTTAVTARVITTSGK